MFGRSRLARYDAAVSPLAFLLFALAAVIVGTVATPSLLRFGCIPAGVSHRLARGLLSAICLGGILLWLTVDDLVTRPHRLQRELVGAQPGSPLRLRHYETHGFQDAHYEWHYSVPPALLHTLKRRCRPIAGEPGDHCLIAGRKGAGWWQGIGLDGETLWLVADT